MILPKLNSFDPQIQFTHEIFTNNNDVHFLDIKSCLMALLSIANPPTPGNTSISLALHLGVGKLLGYVPLYIALIKSVVTMNYYVMNSLILLNLLLGTGFPNNLLIKNKTIDTPKILLTIFGVSIVLLFLKLLNGNRNYY